MSKKTIAILFGGVSTEHDVSLLSARSVIGHMPADRYDVIKIGITKSGEWLRFDGDAALLPGGKWEKDPSCRPAVLSPDRKTHGLLGLDAQGHAAVTRLDAVFPVLHGKNGEDGTVQGLLTLAGIPFVGCGTEASAVCMDKALQKKLLEGTGIRQAKWLSFTRAEFEKDPEEAAENAAASLGRPLFVKPARAGSSVGISRVSSKEEFLEAVRAAFRVDGRVVCEEAVRGREIECAVLGGAEPLASVCGEVVSCNDFYDYDAKYIDEGSRLCIPAKIPAETAAEIRETAVRAFRLLGCEGLARVDFFLREDGAVLLNEPNTIPGFTSISMYPKLFEASGIPYSDLLDRLVRLALEREGSLHG